MCRTGGHVDVLDGGELVRAAERRLRLGEQLLALLDTRGIDLGGRRRGLGLGNGQVDVLHRAECGQGLAEFVGIAGGDNGHAVGLDAGLGDAQDVGLGDRGDSLLILEDEVARIAVVLVAHDAAESLRRGCRS